MANDRWDRELYIVVDGSIASGKSKLCRTLEERCHAQVYPETGHTGGVLDIALRDPKANFGAFQMLMVNHCFTRTQLADVYTGTHPGQMVAVDRSLAGNRVFELVSFHFGKTISSDVHEMYERFVESATCRMPYGDADFSMYLWVPPEVCIERCRVRDFGGEARTYDLDYFWLLTSVSFVGLLENLSRRKPFPQFIVDWTTLDKIDDFIDNLPRIAEWIKMGCVDPTMRPGDLTRRIITRPLQVDLSLSVCAEHKRSQYHEIIDLTSIREQKDFYSREVVTRVMGALAFTDKYELRHVYIQLSPELDRAFFDGAYTLHLCD